MNAHDLIEPLPVDRAIRSRRSIRRLLPTPFPQARGFGLPGHAGSDAPENRRRTSRESVGCCTDLRGS